MKVLGILIVIGLFSSYTPPTEATDIKNISFSFTAKYSNELDHVAIDGTLSNTSANTVYLLTTTCDGTQYSLQYDTSKFQLSAMMQCNASFPMIVKIPPHKNYRFKGYFINRKNETKMKLGFDFYEVDASFDIKKIALSEVHDRPAAKKNLIWAAEQDIK